MCVTEREYLQFCLFVITVDIISRGGLREFQYRNVFNDKQPENLVR